MPSYDIHADVKEWIEECGVVEAAHHYLSTIAEKFANAGEANRAHYYRRLAQEMQRITANRHSNAPYYLRLRLNSDMRRLLVSRNECHPAANNDSQKRQG